MAGKTTSIAAVIGASVGGLDRGLKKAEAMTRSFTRRVEGMGMRLKNAWRNMGISNAMGRMKGAISGMIGFAGIYGVGKLVQDFRSFEATLEDIAIRGNKSLSWVTGLRKEILKLSNETGIGKDQIALFGQTFVELTGNADGAMKAMKSMAMVSRAFGTDMRSLAKLSVSMTEAFGAQVKPENMPDFLTKAMNLMRVQEKAGKFGFEKIATEMPAIFGTLSTSGFGKSAQGLGGIELANALFQMTQRVTPESGEAGTAVVRFLQNLSKNRAKIEKVTGAQLATVGPGGQTQWKDLREVFRIIGTASADPTKRNALGDIFGLQGRKVATALQTYTADPTKKIGGGGSFEEFVNARKTQAYGLNQVEMDYGKRMSGNAAKIDKAMTQISNTFYQKGLPLLLEFSKHIDKFAGLLKFTIQHLDKLIKLWLAWKASKFFQGLAQAPGMMAGMGGMGGMGATAASRAQVAAMYGMGAAGAGRRVGADARVGRFGKTMGALSKVFLPLAIADAILPEVKGKHWGGFDPEEHGAVKQVQTAIPAQILHQALRRKHAPEIRTGRISTGAIPGMEMQQAQHPILRMARIGGLREKLGVAQRMGLETSQQEGLMRARGASEAEISKKLGPQMQNLNNVIRGLQTAINQLQQGIPIRGVIGSSPESRNKTNSNTKPAA